MKTWILVTSIPKQARRQLAAGAVETCNAMTSGATKKDVVENFRLAGIDCSPYLLKEYGSEVTAMQPYCAVAAVAGRVFVQRLNDNDAPWFRLHEDSVTPVPKFPVGTPEYAAYDAELKVELSKFVRGEEPYDMTAWLTEQDEWAFAVVREAEQKETARREQRAREEQENQKDDGIDSLDLRDEICGYPV